MSFQILSNVTSMQALGNLNSVSSSVSKSLQKLSTGLRIVTAGDDASGLQISESMRAQINGLQTDKLNTQEGMNMLQTAEGSLNEVSSILQRINTLAVRASQDVTLTTADRTTMDSEVGGLKSELDRIAADITFNGKALLDGTLTGNLQVGPGATTNDQITVSIATMTSAGLTLTATSVDTAANALAAITATSAAIDAVAQARGNIGVVENRLQHTLANLDVSITNTTAAESDIRDVDMASEISNFTRLQILQQSGVSMLAQANSQPQSVLKLLQ
jgi:flagellin